MKIYHNPRCQKSRKTLELLIEKNQSPEVVLYLKNGLSRNELQSILRKLGMSPFDLIRKNEKLFKEKYKGKKLSDDQWIEVLVEHPILIERPIVVQGKKALIGRPPEKILELL